MELLVILFTSAATIAAILYYLFFNISKSKHFKLPRNVKCQSVIVDDKLGIRTGSLNFGILNRIEIKYYHDILLWSAKNAGLSHCFGYRVKFDSSPVWYTYREVGDFVNALGSGLINMLETKSQRTSTKKIGIYGRNSLEWICTQNALSAYGLTSVPLYHTFGKEALIHIINQVEMCAVVCQGVNEGMKILSCGDTSTIKHLILVNTTKDELVQLKDQTQGVVQIITMKEVLDLGRAKPLPVKEADENDIFLICYTSGSTGLPKGVTFTHRQLVSSIFVSNRIFTESTVVNKDSLYVSYLPLSHIMEQVIMAVFLLNGARIAFITSTTENLVDDLGFYRPTHFITVPRVLCRLHDKVMKAIGTSRLMQYLLAMAIRHKLEEQQFGIYKTSGLLDFIFFRRIRRMIGGKVGFVLCASAPLPSNVAHFTRAAFSCPIVEAYGTTEVSGAAATTFAQDMEPGKAGSVVPGYLVRLADVPSMDIVASRDGVGEVCIKSPACTQGYYKEEQKTRDLFDEHGYMRTGDLGKWGEDGSLMIVDRCKSMFKLSQGEYIAPEKVEQVYSASPLVTNIFVDGNPLQSFPVAVVAPDLPALRALCRSRLADVPPDTSEAALCRMPQVRRLLLEELNETGRKKGLVGFEQVKAIHVSTEPFTIENGLLTATLKLARSTARRHFSSITNDLYQSYPN